MIIGIIGGFIVMLLAIIAGMCLWHRRQRRISESRTALEIQNLDILDWNDLAVGKRISDSERV
jgi:hypothetical protein